MTEERLQLLPEKFLREIAVKEGISFDDTTDKQELIDLIIEAIEEDRQENVLANNPAMHIKERKFDITLNEQFDFEEDQYPLPEQYNETRIMLLLRDPAWAYTYWDIKESDVAAYKLGAMKAELLLRVYELSEKVFSKTAVNDYFDIPVKFNDNSWYINLSSPGSYYTVELLLSGRSGEKSLCRSNSVLSPLWEVGDSTGLTQLKGSGNDLLLVAGVYDLSTTEIAGRIPQRIISRIESQFLEQ